MVSQLIRPAVQWYADLFKLDVGEVASDTFNIGVGNLVDFINNTLYEGLGAKLIGFIQGLAAHGVAGYAIVPGQDKDDLRLVGSYLMWRLLDPSPSDLVQLVNAIGELKAGVQTGNWARVSRSFGVKTPAQIASELASVGASFSRVLSLPLPTTTPTVTRTPTTPTPPAFTTPAALNHYVAPLTPGQAALF